MMYGQLCAEFYDVVDRVEDNLMCGKAQKGLLESEHCQVALATTAGDALGKIEKGNLYDFAIYLIKSFNITTITLEKFPGLRVKNFVTHLNAVLGLNRSK